MGASLTTGNMGVSALAASLVKLILTKRPDASISFFISERTSMPQEIELSGKKISIKVANVRKSPKASLGEHIIVVFFLALIYKIIPMRRIKEIIIKYNERLDIIAKTDFIGDIRGGDSFSDIYGVFNFIFGSIPSIITLLMGQNLVLLPQTYGPYQSNISRRIARHILSHAHIILSRDKESMNLVQEILDKQTHDKQLIFCPDVAFALDAIAPKDGVIQPFTNVGNETPLIGFNINGLLYNGGYTRNNMFNLKMDYRLFVHKLAESLLNNTNANLLLIPHTFAPHGNVESDPDACMEVFMALSPAYKGRIQMITGEYDQHAIKGIIGCCDFFIGSRMHSCIAALSQNIPTAAVAYSKKFKGVFNSVAVGDLVIDARSTDINEAIKIINDLFNNRSSIKTVIERKVSDIKSDLDNMFGRIL